MPSPSELAGPGPEIQDNPKPDVKCEFRPVDTRTMTCDSCRQPLAGQRTYGTFHRACLDRLLQAMPTRRFDTKVMVVSAKSRPISIPDLMVASMN